MISLELVQSVMLATWSMESPGRNLVSFAGNHTGRLDQVFSSLENKASLDARAGPLKVANESSKFANAVADVVTTSSWEGVFPEKLKMARVIPIEKGGVKTDASKYRPISLLPNFSKYMRN